jgi:histidinol-phosphate aminotransferase
VTSRTEKGGGAFAGIKLLLCENPLPPLDEAIEAARRELPRSNHYTEAYSAPLRRAISRHLAIAEHFVHINAGSELILRQLFDRFGQQVHLLTPTYPLFPEIAGSYTETHLEPELDFGFDLSHLRLPRDTSLAVIVNPNNPNGGTFDMTPLAALLRQHRGTWFLVDEAFIGVAGHSVAHLVPEHPNLVVTRTLSKAHSLAGFRVGYAVAPQALAEDLNRHNDAYPLALASEAAAIATLANEDKIRQRVTQLRTWTEALRAQVQALGVRTFPTQTYFFLADFSPRNAGVLADALRERAILVRPLSESRLGPGYMRVTTATPEDNGKFLAALEALLLA